MPVDSDERIRETLEADTIAVVGLSSTPGKAAHDIPAYMREQGYDVVPVNPYADEIFGTEPYDSLTEVEESVDIVDVFRPRDEIPEIVDEAVTRDDAETVWLQLGIVNDEAGERFEEAGGTFVQDRCLKVEHQRLME
jgi:predicted CoA-binding protein